MKKEKLCARILAHLRQQNKGLSVQDGEDLVTILGLGTDEATDFLDHVSGDRDYKRGREMSAAEFTAFLRRYVPLNAERRAFLEVEATGRRLTDEQINGIKNHRAFKSIPGDEVAERLTRINVGSLALDEAGFKALRRKIGRATRWNWLHNIVVVLRTMVGLGVIAAGIALIVLVSLANNAGTVYRFVVGLFGRVGPAASSVGARGSSLALLAPIALAVIVTGIQLARGRARQSLIALLSLWVASAGLVLSLAMILGFVPQHGAVPPQGAVSTVSAESDAPPSAPQAAVDDQPPSRPAPAKLYDAETLWSKVDAGVREALEANPVEARAVVGNPHALFGQVPTAIVLASETEQLAEPFARYAHWAAQHGVREPGVGSFLSLQLLALQGDLQLASPEDTAATTAAASLKEEAERQPGYQKSLTVFGTAIRQFRADLDN